jgi:serine/threonine-protein kinase
MEFVDGPNLERLVRDHGPLSVGQGCDFIRQAALGLQYAHEHGMVHRDIKPGNLLVKGSGGDLPYRSCTVKILDFGLARLGGPTASNGPDESSILAETNAVLGTPDYLSPEQAQNVHKADIRSDLYSLGCTLYFLLTGQPPFPGGSMLAKVSRHLKEKPSSVQKLRPDVPPAITHIVARLLAKKPEDRFQSPAELVSALEVFAMDGPPPWLGGPTRNNSGELGELEASASQHPASDSVLTPDEALRLPPVPTRKRVSFPVLLVATAAAAGIVGYLVRLILK